MTGQAAMMTLYQMQLSGNCYKVRLAAHQLEVPLRLVEIDILRGESRTPSFLARNPNGRVPTLELEDGRALAESNAILLYLAEGTHLLPDDRWQHAKVNEWLFFEQYSHERFIAVARFWMTLAPPAERAKVAHLIPEWHANGYAALGVMEARLARNDWLAGDSYSVADIALYAYTHCAADGGFDLARFPGILAWMKRVGETPRFIAMAKIPW